MKKVSKIPIILLEILLVACQPGVSTISPKVTIERQTTLAVSPTASTMPTSPAPTTIPTRIPPTPMPTLSPEDIAGSVLTELSIDETHAYSPNGFCEWKRILAWPTSEAASLKYDQFFTYVTVSCGNQDPWILVNAWAPAQMGYSIPDLLGWSVDGKYLHFYDSVIPDGCQPPGGFQQDLRQVDLTMGKISSIQVSWTGGMALSADSTKVIYYDWQSGEVGIYNLITGDEQRIPFELPAGQENWFAGDFTWSLDGYSAVFIIQYGDPCFPSGYSLRLVDLRANTVSTLVEKENQTISIVEWTDTDRVSISIGGEKMWLDPVTGSLITP